jgi:A/G-specific adenine glycosylase
LIFLDDSETTLINKRTEKGIWHNLYEFPIIETENEIDFDVLSKLVHENYSDLKIKDISIYNENQIIHKLSHQKLHINFYKVEVSNKLMNGISLNSLRNYPFPIVIYNFIEKYSI